MSQRLVAVVMIAVGVSCRLTDAVCPSNHGVEHVLKADLPVAPINGTREEYYLPAGAHLYHVGPGVDGQEMYVVHFAVEGPRLTPEGRVSTSEIDPLNAGYDPSRLR